MTKKDLPMYLLCAWAALATTFAMKEYCQMVDPPTPPKSAEGWLSAPPLLSGKRWLPTQTIYSGKPLLKYR
jgi:hypothetical protein